MNRVRPVNNIGRNKAIQFKDLQPFYSFKLYGRIYTKIGDSHSIDFRNGHDAIFTGRTVVTPLFPNAKLQKEYKAGNIFL